MKTKNLKTISLLLCMILLIASLCACAASPNAGMDANSFSSGGAMPTAPAAAPMSPSEQKAEMGDFGRDDMAVSEDAAYTAGKGMDATQVIPANPSQKIIYNIYLQMETTAYDDSVTALLDITTKYNGYIQSSNLSGQGINYYNNARYANYVLRVPAGNLNAFLSEIPAVGSIVNQQNNAEDVSDQYYDIEARLKTLKATEERLLELLQKSGELTDIIQLENALSDTRYQIESFEGQMRRMDSYISYSTVTLNISEVAKYTPVNELPKTLGERISLRFQQSIDSVVDGFENFAVWFVGGAPVLIINLLIIGIIVLIIVLIVKKAGKSSAKRREQQMAEYQARQMQFGNLTPPTDSINKKNEGDNRQ